MPPHIRRFAIAALVAPSLPLAVLRAQARPALTDTAAIRAAVERVTPAILEVRHDLHQNPELGNRETRTAGIVAERLRALGIEVRTGVAHTGVVGVLRGARPGPVVALRADMDALPVTEDAAMPFRSTARATYNGQEVGVMHACGHDVHTSVLLGTAAVLAGMRERLPGSVVFIFQPAEEGAPAGERGGAELMLVEGAFRDPRPSAVFGLHTDPALPAGAYGYTPGPALASSLSFSAAIHGRQAHGARPELSVDPIVTAAQVVLALQTIRSRNLSPLAPTVLTVGILRAGERSNIIPAEARLEGTVRTYDAAVEDTIKRRMREIFDGTTRAAGATFTLEFGRSLPATVNDRALTARMVPSLVRIAGVANVRELPPASVSEDFSYFANEVPGLMFWLGVQGPAPASGPLHSPTYRADDGAVPSGIRAMTVLVLDYLGATGR